MLAIFIPIEKVFAMWCKFKPDRNIQNNYLFNKQTSNAWLNTLDFSDSINRPPLRESNPLVNQFANYQQCMYDLLIT